jgi:hypothetical protein
MTQMSKPPAQPSKPSVAEALVKESDPTKVVAWFCTTCGRVFNSKDDAEKCPKCCEWACEDCGKKCTAFQWYCTSCITKHRYQRERKQLMECTNVIPWEEYPSDQGVVWEDEYFQCLQDVEDHCEYHGLELPQRVWATEPLPFMLNTDDILDHAFEEWSDGAEDAERRWDGETELRAAIDAFNQKNSGMLLYYETNKTVVDLTGFAYEEDIEE